VLSVDHNLQELQKKKNTMWGQKNQNKYRNIRQTYNGRSYMSKKEANKAYELDLLKKAGEIIKWQPQAKIELFGENKSHICNYFVDFIVVNKNGTTEYIEIKSPITATPLWKVKWKLLKDKFMEDISRGLIKLTVEY
jgi:dsDNA-binding SOS-regulon protein